MPPAPHLTTIPSINQHALARRTAFEQSTPYGPRVSAPPNTTPELITNLEPQWLFIARLVCETPHLNPQFG